MTALALQNHFPEPAYTASEMTNPMRALLTYGHTAKYSHTGIYCDYMGRNGHHRPVGELFCVFSKEQNGKPEISLSLEEMQKLKDYSGNLPAVPKYDPIRKHLIPQLEKAIRDLNMHRSRMKPAAIAVGGARVWEIA